MTALVFGATGQIGRACADALGGRCPHVAQRREASFDRGDQSLLNFGRSLGHVLETAPITPPRAALQSGQDVWQRPK